MNKRLKICRLPSPTAISVLAAYKYSAIGKYFNFKKLTVTKNFRMRVIFAFLRSATEIWTTSFTRRHSSKNLGLVLILRVTPLARNSLFNLLVIIFYVTFLFNDLLFFSCVYKTFIRNFFFIRSWRPRTSKRRRII